MGAVGKVRTNVRTAEIRHGKLHTGKKSFDKAEALKRIEQNIANKASSGD